jgi:hypothetical protein
MKKIFLVLVTVMFISASVYADNVTIGNIEINIPKDWKVKTKDLKSKNLILVAGHAATRPDIFVMDSQRPRIATDDNKSFTEKEVTVTMDFDGQYLDPIINIYKIAANGKTVEDYRAAETMTLRIQTGGKVVESKDNFIVATYPDGINDVKQIEYLYVVGDNLYIVLFASNIKNFDGYRLLFNDINTSFKIK